MDVPDDDFWRLFFDVLLSIEQEFTILEEILLDDDDWEVNEAYMVAGLGNPLEDLENMLARFIQVQHLEMDLEEEIIIGLIYGRNDKTIDWRADLPKMQYYRELEDPQFLLHFRMDRVTFERLIVVMGNHLTEQERLIRLRTEIDKCLLMALWVLFNLDTFRTTAEQFKVSKGTVHFHYLVVIEALRELAPKYIKWPSLQDRQRIKERIEARYGYPGIVGMIDGTLIKITAPLIQKARYYDRHQSYSLNIQAICDDNLLFRDVYIGQPGSVHDIRVFERSPLSDMLLERHDLVAEDEHIIGDGGYELRRKVLIPFRDMGAMTVRQRRFNYVHSSIRMAVERSFGRLKGKFRRLFYLHVKRFEYGIDHILSSFVLHNFILLEGREADGECFMVPQQQINLINDEDDVEEEEEEDEDIMNEGVPAGGVNQRAVGMHPLLAQSKIAGNQKREAIADQLMDLLNGV